jgi:hypothetical protein
MKIIFLLLLNLYKINTNKNKNFKKKELLWKKH